MRDTVAFAAAAQRDEARPRFGWGSLDFLLQYSPDTVSTLIDFHPRRAGAFKCPPPFRQITFESFDGTPIAAQVAARDDRPRPGLVVVHGTFGTGGQALYANQAIEAYAQWGFNVVAIDLRGWGRSAALSDAVITCGWRESEDVLAAARYLKEHTRTTTVGAIGYSLGGGSVLNAAASELATELLDGGVFSESGFCDARPVVEHLAHRPSVLSPQYLVYWIFRLGFGIKFRATGLKGLPMPDYAARYVPERCGLDADEVWRRASVFVRAGEIRVPAFHLHAEDDWVVPVEQAYKLRSAAAGNRLVGVCVRPRGAHCAFAHVMGEWRSRLARTFFASVAGIRLER